MSQANEPQATVAISTRESYEKYPGLCTICDRAATCTLDRDPARPITECDEFACQPLERFQAKRGSLIAVLEHVQSRFGYLPVEALKVVAAQARHSLVDIYGIATFYRAFSLEPRGRHLVSVCLGTACHVRGGPTIAKEFERQLKVRAGQTTPDREFTLETVNCLGACALGPTAVVDGHYIPKVKTTAVADLIARTRAGFDAVRTETDQRVFPLDVSCARCNHTLMDPRHVVDGRPAIRVTTSFDDKHGWLALSSLYGSYDMTSEYPIPASAVVQFFCPHCHAELSGGTACGECGAPMIPMIVRGGGVVQICARRGCKGHLLDVDGSMLG